MATTTTAQRPAPARQTAPRSDQAGHTAPDDVLVFEHAGNGFSLIGGTGRGSSWAGIVDVASGTDCLIDEAWRIGVAARRDGRRPIQIVGPYYARHGIAIPVGQRHVVVLGSDRRVELTDTELVRLAATAVDQAQGVPADKLLADELELVHALRALMAYRPDTVRDTMRHVATIAAGALSCELATIRVEHDGQTLTEALTLDDQSPEPSPSEATSFLDLATLAEAPIVAQASDAGWELFGTAVASHMALQIGKTPALGALLLGHSVARPRGFTSLCQRIARALADAAELLLSQAAAREQLAAERDLLARMTRTDPLTGAPNRRAWDDAVERFASARTGNVGHVLSCDLDGLKAANDRYGHPAGDALIRATANLLLSCVRDTDLVARLGGDEFAVLLYDADAKAAEAVTRRIRRAERLWRITEHGLTPRFSLGLANIIDGDVEDARQRADARMYANKRLRVRRAASDPTTRRPNRRRSR